MQRTTTKPVESGVGHPHGGDLDNLMAYSGQLEAARPVTTKMDMIDPTPDKQDPRLDALMTEYCDARHDDGIQITISGSLAEWRIFMKQILTTADHHDKLRIVIKDVFGDDKIINTKQIL